MKRWTELIKQLEDLSVRQRAWADEFEDVITTAKIYRSLDEHMPTLQSTADLQSSQANTPIDNVSVRFDLSGDGKP